MERGADELGAGLLFVKTIWPVYKSECENFHGSFGTPTQTLDTIRTVMRIKRIHDELNDIISKLEKQFNTLHRLRVQVMHAWIAR